MPIRRVVTGEIGGKAVFILSGRIVVELAGGTSKELNPGDVVIQDGTRHRWRNPYDAPCTLRTVSIGLKRAAV